MTPQEILNYIEDRPALPIGWEKEPTETIGSVVDLMGKRIKSLGTIIVQLEEDQLYYEAALVEDKQTNLTDTLDLLIGALYAS